MDETKFKSKSAFDDEISKEVEVEGDDDFKRRNENTTTDFTSRADADTFAVRIQKLEVGHAVTSANSGGIDNVGVDDIEDYYRQNNKKYRLESDSKLNFNCENANLDISFGNKANSKTEINMLGNLPQAEKVQKKKQKASMAKEMAMEVDGTQIESQSHLKNSKLLAIDVPVKPVLTKVNNPLLMPEILEQIFDFMQRYQDEKTMLNICGVNKLWNEIMRNRMSKFETTEILQCPPSPVGPTSPTCKKFYITLPLDNHAEFTNFCKTTGRQMRELNLSFKTCLEETDQIYPINDTSIDSLFKCVHQYCPFVKTLNVWRNVLDIPPSDTYFRKHFNSSSTNTKNKDQMDELVLPFKEIVNMFWNDAKGCDLLKEIIIHSPFLDSLTFMHSSTSVMIDVLRILSQSQNKLRKLTSLRTIGMGITKEFINFVLGHEWSNLKFLDIEVNDESISTDRIRALLNHLSGTLKTIKIKFMDLEFNVGPSVKESTWLLPASMKSLQFVELVLPSLSATACSSFFVNVLQLPQMKSFKLSQTARSYVIDDEDIEQDLTHLNLFGILWNGQDNVLRPNHNQENSSSNTVKEVNRVTGPLISTIEKLNVSQTMTDPSLFQQIPNPLENLTELKLQSVSVDVLLSIFSSLRNLERLSFIADTFENVGEKSWDRKYWLNFSHLNGRILDWDEILTGNMKKDGNGGKYQKWDIEKPEFLMLPTSPSIKNLQKLKYLYIIPMDTDVFLTDFFIYYGAFHLKGLQHLVIRENYFTEKALQDLREELLPFCHLEVKCD